MGKMKQIYIDAMELGLDPQGYFEALLEREHGQFKDMKRNEPTNKFTTQSYQDMETAALSSSIMESERDKMDQGYKVFGK